MTPEDIAKRCIEKILADMTDRRGLRQEWDNIDEDIQEEIKETWQEVIVAELNPIAEEWRQGIARMVGQVPPGAAPGVTEPLREGETLAQYYHRTDPL